MTARNSKFFYFFLTFLVLLLGYLSYKVVKPFFAPIAWAIVFAIVFYPLYLVFLKYVKFKSLSSFFTVIAIILILLGPISYFAYMLVNEIADMAQHLEAGHYNIGDILEHPSIAWVLERIKTIPPLEDLNVEGMLIQTASNIRSVVIGSITVGARNLLQLGTDFVIMLFTAYFLLKDGPDFIGKLRNYLPFSDPQKDRLERQVKDMVISTIYGGILVAMIQGAIGGTAFWALGLPGFVLWGAAIFIFSFVPVIGTTAVWGPAAIYLFLSGQAGKGIILTLIGAFIIGMVDNLLKPIIISGRTKMHTLLIFFSVLGGINVFGIIGLIMGPLTVALFVSVLDIFGRIEEGGTDANY